MAPVFECKWLSISMLWLTSLIKSVIDLSGLKISTSAILPFDDDKVCSSNTKSEKLLKMVLIPSFSNIFKSKARAFKNFWGTMVYFILIKAFIHLVSFNKELVTIAKKTGIQS